MKSFLSKKPNPEMKSVIGFGSGSGTGCSSCGRSCGSVCGDGCSSGCTGRCQGSCQGCTGSCNGTCKDDCGGNSVNVMYELSKGAGPGGLLTTVSGICK